MDRVLFVNVSNGIKRKFNSLGIGHMIASLKPLGLDIKSVKLRTVRELRPILAGFNPDVVCLSSVSKFWGDTVRLARYADKVSTVIVGGHHISLLPESLDVSMKIGVIGEGDYTIIEILSGKPLDEISGIIFRKDNGLHYTGAREPIDDLGKLPHPYRISDDNHVMTSRGCMFDCSFCSSKAFWKGFRSFPAKWVVEEINSVKDMKRVDIWDDQFIVDKKRLEQIVSLMQVYRPPLAIHARANTVKSDIIPYLKELNVQVVGMGIESGSDRMLKILKGGSITIKQIDRALGLLRDAGIGVHCSFILGHPDENSDDLRATEDFIRSRKIKRFDINMFTPMPGTRYWTYGIPKDLDFYKRLDSTSIKEPVLNFPAETVKTYKRLNRLKTLNRIRNILNCRNTG